MDANDAALLAWAADSVAKSWRRASVTRIEALKGDASTRRFWRVHIASSRRRTPPSAILVDLGPDDLPLYARALNLLAEPLDEPPWLNVHRFLTSIGAPVPALYACDRRLRAMLVEDVGTLALADAVRRPGADIADLFRLAIEQLLIFQVEGTRAIDSRCVAARIAYDERLLRWEMEQFAELETSAVAGRAEARDIAPELDRLAAELGKLPRVFSHRDFHGNNLFLQPGDGEPRLRIIDFQDALMAPAAQDLAVLMTTRDTGTIVTPAIERRLLDFYYAGLTRRRAATLDADSFIRSYRLCVIQHALKVIGRFTRLERDGKHGYAVYIPHSAAQARRVLAGDEGRDFPHLRSLFDSAAVVEASR